LKNGEKTEKYVVSKLTHDIILFGGQGDCQKTNTKPFSGYIKDAILVEGILSDSEIKELATL